MIKKSVHEDDIIAGMLLALEDSDKREAMDNLGKAANYLHSAAEIFEDFGLTVQADQVLSVLLKIASEHKSHDPGDTIEFKSLMNQPNKPGDIIELEGILKDDKPSKEPNGEEISFESLLGDDQDARKKKNKEKDRHIPKSLEQMEENYKQFGWAFNMSDDGKADDMLNLDIKDEPLELASEKEDSDFEDEDDDKIRTSSAKYAQVAPAAKSVAPAPPTIKPVVPSPSATKMTAPAVAVPSIKPTVPATAQVPAVSAQTPAEAAAAAAAKKAALEAAKAAATAAKAAAAAAATAAKDAADKLKSLETDASLQYLLSKYADNAAPSSHVRSWDPSAKGTSPSEKPSINHVEGNVGTDRKATDFEPGIGVDAPSHKATDTVGGVNAPSHRATDPGKGVGVDAPDHKATDLVVPAKGDDSDAQTAGGAKLDDTAAPVNSGSGGNGPSDVRSPTSTEVRSPTSTEVRSPTSTEVRSPTSTSTEVRSPTSTSTEAYTADNFTATVTGGAGDGACTTVNIYLTPPTTPKTNKNVPHDMNDKKSSMNYLMSKYS